MTIVIALIVVVVLLALLVRAVEPRLAFFPSRGETITPRDIGVDFETLTVDTRDGERLRAWRLPARTPRARVLYFHGNGGNLSLWTPILVMIARQGYSVVAIDYRGYGLSSGRPSEQGLYHDVDAVLDRSWPDAESRLPLIYWGRSLGATLAAYAASRKSPDGVILESGFPDARALVRSSPPLALLSVFSTYRFPTAAFLENVRVPTLVMHGDHDQVVPFALGRALFERMKGPKQFVTISGADHNDADPPDPRAYWSAIDSFIAALR